MNGAEAAGFGGPIGNVHGDGGISMFPELDVSSLSFSAYEPLLTRKFF